MVAPSLLFLLLSCCSASVFSANGVLAICHCSKHLVTLGAINRTHGHAPVQSTHCHRAIPLLVLFVVSVALPSRCNQWPLSERPHRRYHHILCTTALSRELCHLSTSKSDRQFAITSTAPPMSRFGLCSEHYRAAPQLLRPK